MAGKYYEDLEVGQRIKHSLGRTITEADNTLFCALTMNTQPLHLNEDFAATTPFGHRIVNGIFTMGLVVGLTVPELTEGTIIANLASMARLSWNLSAQSCSNVVPPTQRKQEHSR